MKLYRTKENNVINLEQVTLIYRNPGDGLYRIGTADGKTYEMPEIDKDDIEKIMEYNNYLID